MSLVKVASFNINGSAFNIYESAYNFCFYISRYSIDSEGYIYNIIDFMPVHVTTRYDLKSMKQELKLHFEDYKEAVKRFENLKVFL